MQDLIYGTLSVTMHVQVPQTMDDSERRFKPVREVQLWKKEAITMDEAKRLAGDFAKQNHAILNFAVLRIVWQPEAQVIKDFEV